MYKSVVVVILFGLTVAAAYGPGDLAWSNRYNGPGNDFDYAVGIAVDGDGNCYVTGYSPGPSTGNDFATIKYDASGQQVWLQRYAGPSYSDDVPVAIKLDNQGNVYIAGRGGIYPNYNIITIKYNSAGEQQWVATWAGPGNNADYAGGLAVNPATGEVCVAGWSVDATTLQADIVVVKYNSSGTQLWEETWDNGGNDYGYAVAMDGSGNVYVAGATGEDYVTLKFGSAGGELWNQVWNGQGNASDVALAIAVDGSGNCYVTGKTATAPPPSGNWNIATLKYDPDGNQQWSAVYTGVGRDDIPAAITLDQTGNVYLTGSSVSPQGGSDCITLKYDGASGSQTWQARYNSAFNGTDAGANLVVDSLGRVHVVGSSTGNLGTPDYLVLRYSATGTQDWAVRYDSPYHNDDKGVGIGLDRNLNVYVTGSSYGGVNPMGYDFCTLKYEANGSGGLAELRPVLPEGRLVAHPNPARSAFMVDYQLSRAGQVRLELIDMAGRMVATLLQADRPAGDHQERLKLEGVAKGVYLLRLSGPGAEAGAILVVD